MLVCFRGYFGVYVSNCWGIVSFFINSFCGFIIVRLFVVGCFFFVVGCDRYYLCYLVLYFFVFLSENKVSLSWVNVKMSMLIFFFYFWEKKKQLFFDCVGDIYQESGFFQFNRSLKILGFLDLNYEAIGREN